MSLGAACSAGNLDQTARIGGHRIAHHQHQIGLRGDLFNRALAVAGGIADVTGTRAGNVAKAGLDRANHPIGIAHTKGGLHGIGNRAVGRQIERVNIIG